jgi:hypothetical protein
LAICFGPIRAGDRSGTTLPEDDKERWLSEFDVASNKPLGPDRAAREVKLVYGKNAKWLLFNPAQHQNFVASNIH